MNTRIRTLALGLALAAGTAQAAGPLYMTNTTPPRPLKWDTSKGPIPVYTDGGGAFTYNFDGVTPFITIERADEITAFAFQQWSAVPTSTFRAQLAGKYIDTSLGIADITGANAAEVYNKENGYGFWVNYDTNGDILQNYFGVSRNSVLGIAFPEWADEEGNITEATAVLNGWYVDAKDTQGNMVAGVFTHEFGHAINLSHSQVNGHIAYNSQPTSPLYPGVKGCVSPIYRWDGPTSATWAPRMDPAAIETMHPFVNTRTLRAGDGKNAGIEMSKIELPDDMAAISNLYPTANYKATKGSISGVLYLKDGKTQYSGINVIARNVASPIFDAVSAMSGDQTQGKVGPDGRFTINNLTPGQQYYVYIEQIYSGGYPTSPQRLASESEYWDANEGTIPAEDLPCNRTGITAEAGVTKKADIYFNGYRDGVDFVPIVNAYLTDLSKDGRRSAGLVNTTSQTVPTSFMWDLTKGLTMFPPSLRANNGSMTRNGQWMTVQYNYNASENNINQASLYSWTDNKLISLGDVNGDTCGGSGASGVSSSYGWAVDDAGRTSVGTVFKDVDGDKACSASAKGEIRPFIWDAKKGLRELDKTGVLNHTKNWVRAHAISGNGRVILGTSNIQRGVAWVDEGQAIDLQTLFGVRDLYAVNYDGSKVALQGYASTGQAKQVQIWNPYVPNGAAVTPIGGMRWCVDLPYNGFMFNCTTSTPEQIFNEIGYAPIQVNDMNDDGTVLVGRAGDRFSGTQGAIWIQDLGWMTWANFFRKQGVAEASVVPFDNPIAISASGREVVGGVVAVQQSWWVNIDQVYVCESGVSVKTGFPNGLRDKVKAGAQFGRCEHLN